MKTAGGKLSFDHTQCKLKIGQKNASLKYTTSCVVSFKKTGWYECCQTDYNANVDFVISRKCLVEPTGCQQKSLKAMAHCVVASLLIHTQN